MPLTAEPGEHVTSKDSLILKEMLDKFLWD
jgi:hypothetical protein